MESTQFNAHNLSLSLSLRFVDSVLWIQHLKSGIRNICIYLSIHFSLYYYFRRLRHTSYYFAELLLSMVTFRVDTRHIVQYFVASRSILGILAYCTHRYFHTRYMMYVSMFDGLKI